MGAGKPWPSWLRGAGETVCRERAADGRELSRARAWNKAGIGGGHTTGGDDLPGWGACVLAGRTSRVGRFIWWRSLERSADIASVYTGNESQTGRAHSSANRGRGAASRRRALGRPRRPRVPTDRRNRANLVVAKHERAASEAACPELCRRGRGEAPRAPSLPELSYLRVWKIDATGQLHPREGLRTKQRRPSSARRSG
jgi:hypothetical protein